MEATPHKESVYRQSWVPCLRFPENKCLGIFVWITRSASPICMMGVTGKGQTKHK